MNKKLILLSSLLVLALFFISACQDDAVGARIKIPAKTAPIDDDVIPIENGGGGECNTGETKQCGTTDMGVCQYGNQICKGGKWTSCSGNVESIPEICGDSLDNDCDGLIDMQDSDCEEGTVCGNGIIEIEEECDDGNTASGDGCSSSCEIEELDLEEGCTETPLYPSCSYPVYNFSEICNVISDCNWTVFSGLNGMCSGELQPCDQQDEVGCMFIPGCYWN